VVKPIQSVAVAIIASVTIASAADGNHISWNQAGDSALQVALVDLVGPDVIDCGLVDLRKRKPKSEAKRAALDCIASAEQRRLPFKFGIARLFLGSIAYEVYARSTKGESWLLAHGLNLAENVVQSSMERCLFIDVSPRTLLISGSDCSRFKLLSEQPA